jgi:5-methylcytosine-specific restriction endonuclease McrA
MLKSCKYCGGVHPVGYVCPKKPKRKKAHNNTYAKDNYKVRLFRSSGEWTKKSKEVRNRDNNICQVCYRELYEYCTNKYNCTDVSVHHIEKISNNWDKRLDNYNLITLCPICHTAADLGEIPANVLKEIAREQEDKANKEYGV